MAVARSTVVREGEAGVYHCISRCVRRAFLCGVDSYTGKNYDHRKAWVGERLKLLTEVFGVEVYAYAALSNHLHLVLRVDPELAECWDNEEVVQRWNRLFPKERDVDGHPVDLSEEVLSRWSQDESKVKLWRERLGNLSWFMRCLNESIARRANREDECSGRFCGFIRPGGTRLKPSFGLA